MYRSKDGKKRWTSVERLSEKMNEDEERKKKPWAVGVKLKALCLKRWDNDDGDSGGRGARMGIMGSVEGDGGWSKDSGWLGRSGFHLVIDRSDLVIVFSD